MDCTCTATPGPHAPHCDGCTAPADRCTCDEVPDGPAPASVPELAAEGRAEISATERTLVGLIEEGIIDKRDALTALGLSIVEEDRPTHVPASVPDGEVDQYLDWYPNPQA